MFVAAKRSLLLLIRALARAPATGLIGLFGLVLFVDRWLIFSYYSVHDGSKSTFLLLLVNIG